MGNAKWFLETRPQFLLLAVVLVLHGSAAAFYWTGRFDWYYFVLAIVGLVLMHASVNVLNDWHDMKTGIDLNVKRTPFSGGSGLLPSGEMTSGQALGLGIGTLVAGAACGLYIAWDMGWPLQLLAIGVAGAVLIVAYTPVFNRIGIGEIAAGVGLGLLPVMGAYFVQAGRIDTIAIVSGVPAFLLTYNLLLLNEFPDLEADRGGGRVHMLTLLGRKRARWLYAAVEISAFALVAIGVAIKPFVGHGFPVWVALALLAAIPGAQAIRIAMTEYDKHEELIPALGANVMAVLGINLLLAVGYLIAGLTR